MTVPRAIGPTSAAGAVDASPAEASAPAATPQSLLVLPVDGSLPADPIALLYVCESKDADMNVRVGSAKIRGFEGERHKALHDEQKAIQDAIDAQKSRSFWDDLGNVCEKVAKVAAVVASVAAAVATAGGATPLFALAVAGCVMSSASLVDGEGHVLQKLGVDANTAGWIDTGLALGGAICSGGAAVAAGGQIAGGVASTVARAGAVVSGVGQVGAGASHIAAGFAERDEETAQAHATGDDARWLRLVQLIQATVDDTKNSDDQSQRAKGVLADTMTTRDATLSAAIFTPST